MCKMCKKGRQCYTCGRKIWFSHLLYTFYMKHMEEFFPRDMLEEIWGNEIFVIECCYCQKIRKENSKIKELLIRSGFYGI